jgi:hypothetical protein
LAARTRSSSGAGLAVALAVVGVVALPAAVGYSRESSTFSLLDAAWFIPLAAVASVAALLVVRGTGGHVQFAPLRSARVARVLAVAGICIALAGAIAVGFYELLLRLEG